MQETCYQSANTYATFIELHLDGQHRRALNASQLIEFTLEPNPASDDDKNLPPQKLSLMFSTADIVILGWRLGLIADYLRDNKLAAIGVLPKRYAELERGSVFVSGIVIVPINDDGKRVDAK